jgi:molybdopterin synthase sulfur carrier subunit
MAIEVRIPTPLRKFTENQEAVSVDGSTVGEVLANLTESHPELKNRLFKDDGSVRRFVNIFANAEDIRFQDDLDTALEDGDSVSIVPAIAGGSS